MGLNNSLLVARNSNEFPSWAKSPLTGRYLNDLSIDSAELDGPSSKESEHLVRARVTQLLLKVAEQDSRFTGKLIPSGSYYEGTKVRYPNEFDFMFELSTPAPESVIPKHVIPPILRPTEEEPPHRGYFLLDIDLDRTIESDQAIEYTGELDSDLIHRTFFDHLQRITEQEEPGIYTLSVKDLKRKGPAVSIWFALRTSACVKVDIVLAVSVLWSNLKLEESYIETFFTGDDDIKTLNLVPSGNYWKLSVAKQESRLIRTLTGVSWEPQETLIYGREQAFTGERPQEFDLNQICSGEGISNDVTSPQDIEPELHSVLCDGDPVETNRERSTAQINRRDCLLALKCLRDSHEAGTLDRTILPSYPLKVTFLQECRDYPSDEDWMEERLGRRVYSILDRVDTQSEDGNLMGYFLPNVPIFKNPAEDISVHARKIKYDLSAISTVHKVFCLLLILGSLGGLAFVSFRLYYYLSYIIFLCCSPIGQLILQHGQECVIFKNSTCSTVHIPQPTEIILLEQLGIALFWIRSVWYILVLPLSAAFLACLHIRRYQLVFTPLSFRSIPTLVSVLSIIISYTVVTGNDLQGLLVIASIEGVYLCYELISLISGCLLLNRAQPIGDCVGPFKKCAKPKFIRNVKPYFE